MHSPVLTKTGFHAHWSDVGVSDSQCRCLKQSGHSQAVPVSSTGSVNIEYQTMMEYNNFKHPRGVVGQREKRIHNLFDCKFNSRQAGLLIHVIDCGAMAVGTGNDVIQTKQLGSGRSIPQEISTLEYTLEKKNRKHRLIMHPGAHSTPRHLSIVTLYEHRYIGCIHTVSSSVG